MSNPTPASDPLQRRSSSTAERVLFALCAASLIAYLGCSVAVRAFINELARLGGKFLG